MVHGEQAALLFDSPYVVCRESRLGNQGAERIHIVFTGRKVLATSTPFIYRTVHVYYVSLFLARDGQQKIAVGFEHTSDLPEGQHIAANLWKNMFQYGYR